MQASVRLNQTSRAACALTSWRDRIQLAWVGTDRRLNLASSADGQEFADTQRLPHRTYSYDRSSSDDTFSDIVVTSPAIVGAAERLHLAWSGTDRRINLLTLAEQRSGAHVRLEQARTQLAPAVCSHRGSLVLAWTGSDRRVNLLTVAENQSTAPIRLEMARSDRAPAVCSHGGKLVVAWTGSDAHLNLALL